jgi:hypothetical protein
VGPKTSVLDFSIEEWEDELDQLDAEVERELGPSRLEAVRQRFDLLAGHLEIFAPMAGRSDLLERLDLLEEALAALEREPQN